MQTAGISRLSVSALLAALVAFLPSATAQTGRWDHAFSQSGRWDQAFRSTGSQAFGQPPSHLPANGHFSPNNQLSVFDTDSMVSNGYGFGYPGLPWHYGVYSPWPVAIQTPPLPRWRTPWGGSGVLYPTIPLAGNPWPEFAAVDVLYFSPIAPVSCCGAWGAGPCGGLLLFPVVQSCSFQSISVQAGPLAAGAMNQPATVSRPPQSLPLVLQANSLPPAFDPADPQLLNFTAPARGQIPGPPVAVANQLPGIAAQPVPEPLPAAANPDAAARKVLADGGIVLRGKRKLANRAEGN